MTAMFAEDLRPTVYRAVIFRERLRLLPKRVNNRFMAQTKVSSRFARRIRRVGWLGFWHKNSPNENAVTLFRFSRAMVSNE
jgi:hypothetical protein